MANLSVSHCVDKKTGVCSVEKAHATSDNNRRLCTVEKVAKLKRVGYTASPTRATDPIDFAMAVRRWRICEPIRQLAKLKPTPLHVNIINS